MRRSSRFDSFAQPSSGSRHQPARRSENPPQAQIVPQTRCDRRTPGDLLCHLVVTEVKEVRVNDGQRTMVPEASWQLVRRSNDRFYPVAAAEQLFHQQSPRRAAGANDQNRHVAGKDSTRFSSFTGRIPAPNVNAEQP
jgi:hypothetical protein